jgi:acetylornithine deacetylase/succinyl-diaminopimelate desuccinylase-like protein
MSDALPRVLDRLDAMRGESQARWFDILRIPSVSAQPKHDADCARAAEWFRVRLAEIGFTASVRPTEGKPVVVAHHPGPGGNAPHLLYYGHYDVQPPEPLELWTTPPFDPTLVDGPHGKRVYARGAVDDKGQTMMWLEAFRAWQQETGSLPVRVSVVIEGEEEVGSKSLKSFVAANRDELRADICVISDTGMWDIDTPAISTQLRGMVYTQVNLKGASKDLHSGVFGGSALNAINALTKILGGLHDENGRVQIPGFYDRVRELDPAQAAQWQGLGFDEAAFLGGVGLKTPIGERDRPALERLWSRPTADVNGIWGGYAGVGSKTVIPAEAGAKVSFRLVSDQDPQEIIAGFRRFIAERKPVDAEVELEVFGAGPAIVTPPDSPWVRAAQAALADEYGRRAVLAGCGGSIPIVDSFHNQLGLDALLIGFGLDDDQVHSPNEKFEVRCFEQGARCHARLLAKLAA